MDWEKTLFNKLLIALPELNFEQDYIELGVERGWITPEQAEMWKKSIRVFKKGRKIGSGLSKGDFLQRIMSIAPEIMSVGTVDFLRRVKINGEPIISVTTANALRVAFNGAEVLKPVFTSDAQLLKRIEAVYGALTSQYLVNLLRDLDNAKIAQVRNAILRDRNGVRLNAEEAAPIKQMLLDSIRRAQSARSLFSTTDILINTVAAAKAQDTVWGSITVVLDRLFGYVDGDRLLKNAIRAGLISENKYALIRSIEQVGMDVWNKVGQARRYESWAARSLILSEGILSANMIKVLREAGYISPQLAKRLYPVATAIRAVTRASLTQYQGGPKFHVRAGESPIQTYARIGQDTDRQILSLLSRAAEDAKKEIAANIASDKFGKTTGAARQQVVLAGIHERMREVWEDVGSLTIFGEKEAAAAALVATEHLAVNVYEDFSAATTIKAQARAGVNAYISRQENVVGLSRRVYRNSALSMGIVEDEVNKALIRGLSARELASNVRGLIHPSVQGGVSYAAMRLARTEINNAFHFGQLRYAREMPWVSAHKWNLSNSHPKGQRGDPCADMASRNHDGLGKGVYKKGNVPGKPHPHCLCFLTTVTHDNKRFYRNLRNGAYSQYLTAAEKTPFEGEFRKAQTTRDTSMDYLKDMAAAFAKAGALGLATGLL